MAAATTGDVVGMLREYGRRLILAGGNPYRARAYVRAADALASLGEPLEDLIAGGRLTEIQGVGDAIAAATRKALMLRIARAGAARLLAAELAGVSVPVLDGESE